MSRLRTKSYFEKRVARLASMLRPEVKDSIQVRLSCYNPDNANRYQIELVHKNTGKEIISLPKWGHYRAIDFDRYLEGFLDAIEENPYFGKK